MNDIASIDPKSLRTIQRILKVNHAGEYGAIRIYKAQLLISDKLHPSLSPFLSETLSHEIEHCKLFKDAMPQRQARPCRAMWLWSTGGYVLGLITALLGKNAIMICTASVERAVHQHMDDQIRFLDKTDKELQAIILDIQEEELSHLHYAEERAKMSGLFAHFLDWFVTLSTEIVIWLSTWGDSSRMKKEIAKGN